MGNTETHKPKATSNAVNNNHTTTPMKFQALHSF